MNSPAQYNPQNQEVPKNSQLKSGHTHELPIDRKKESLLEKIDSSSSVVLVGETGSGKTTKTPQYLLDRYPDKKIAITSPRVFPARSVSKYVAESRGSVVGGGEVGLITRQERKISEDTKATFMTDGVLLNMLRKDEALSDLDIVMVDEAHERTINIDLLLGLLKRAQKLRQVKGVEPLKVIVASATIEEEKFTTYFNEAPVEKVEGRMYPVNLTYHPVGINPDTKKRRTDTEEVAVLAKSILDDKSSTGDILIFMPGEDEINKTIQAIENLIPKDSALILPLFGAMNPKDQDLIFSTSDKRKIIVATNIAETSVTIDGVEHVIDSGSAKEKRYNPETGINSLEIIQASQANMNQRMGRAGRTAPGDCYRIMSEQEFLEREQFQKPELLRSDLGEVVLRMKEMGIKDVENFDFIDTPPRASIHAALIQLTELGALDDNGDITELGREMFELQLRPDLARMLVEAKHLSVVPQMVDVCAMLSASKQILIKPRLNGPNQEENWRNEDKLRRQNELRVDGSDILTMHNVWQEWVQSGKSMSFAIDHLLNTKALNEVELIRMQLLRTLGDAGISSNGGGSRIFDVNTLVRCILSGAPGAVFYGDGKRRYYTPIESNSFLGQVQIFPGSSVFMKGKSMILGLNINRSEKIVDGMKRQTLYARTCHNLSINDIREVLGDDAVQEKAIGSPYYSIYSRDVGSQAYEIRVKGVLVETISKEVYVLERGICSWLDVHNDNEQVMSEYESLRRRSGKNLPRLALDDIYRNLIQTLGVTTKEEVIEHEQDFRLSIYQFISPKEKSSIEEESPAELFIGGKRLKIEYIPEYVNNKHDVYIHIPDAQSAIAVSQAILPAFPRANAVKFNYRYDLFSSPEEILEHIDRQKIELAESIKRQEERYKERLAFDTAQRELSDNEHLDSYTVQGEQQPKATLGDLLSRFEKIDTDKTGKEVPPQGLLKNKVEKVFKKELNKDEQMTIWKSDIDTVKYILSYIRGIIDNKDEKSFKDKQKILDRLKELRTESNSFIRSLEGSGNEHVSLEGRISSLIRDAKVHMKRAGLEQPDTILQVFKNIQEQLIASAKRNEVVITEEISLKIAEKSITLALENKDIISNDRADEVLIDIV